jgi:hypothetical protein
MLALALIRLHRLFLLVTLAVALTATGFAHRMPTDPDAVAFALATGATLDDFCGDGPDGATTDRGCLACQITATADLPPTSATLIDLQLAFHAQVIAPRANRALQRVLNPARTPQGPPVA